MLSIEEKINIIKLRGWEEYTDDSWIMFYYKTRRIDKFIDSKNTFGYLLATSLENAFNSILSNKNSDGFLKRI